LTRPTAHYVRRVNTLAEIDKSREILCTCTSTSHIILLCTKSHQNPSRYVGGVELTKKWSYYFFSYIFNFNFNFVNKISSSGIVFILSIFTTNNVRCINCDEICNGYLQTISKPSLITILLTGSSC
jgi:hypothetical protein